MTISWHGGFEELSGGFWAFAGAACTDAGHAQLEMVINVSQIEVMRDL